jgi:5-methylcytosine-specific restriction endonuclease McrA
MNYREQLKHPFWQKKRLEIFNRDNFTCQKCNSTDKQLQVHHLSYSKLAWEVSNDQMITLCFQCHKDVEFDKTIKPKENYIALINEMEVKLTTDITQNHKTSLLQGIQLVKKEMEVYYG